MIGFGSLHGRLNEIIKEHQLLDSVTIVKTNNVLDYLHRSKIFVMASLSEGIPCALMESMACELIPIVTNVGDISDVIANGKNGILYDGSLAALTRQMKDILLMYDNLSVMRINARKTIISEHSYEVATAKWDALLSRIE